MKPNRNQLIRVAVAACLAASLSVSVMAQNDIEEIIVTATKRQQTLQEVPVAVSVTNSDTIEKSHIQDIFDLQSLVPSLGVTQLQSSTNTNFIIRGFGNGANNAGIEPSVGVFIDGVYRSRSAGAISDLPNLQRVEVLRGPQSTLFGKNASAGVISVVTAKPDSEWGGSTELTLGNYGLTTLKADVTGGITDELAGSFYVSSNQRDGYFENLATNLDGTPVSDAFNERDRSGLRGQLLYTPTDNTEFRLILDSDSIDENCCGVANLQDGDTGNIVRALGGNLVSNEPFAYAGYFNKPSQSKVDNEGISLQADITFSASDLTSITAFRNQELYYDQDADFTSADLLGNVGLDQDIQTITQEVRLTSSGDSNLEWMAGLFWFKEDVYAAGEALFGDAMSAYGNQLLLGATGGTVSLGDLETVASFYDTPDPTDFINYSGTFYSSGSGVRDFGTQADEALSLFGQVDWHINDSHTVTLGLNHTQDDKEVSLRHVSDATFANTDFANVFFNRTFFDTFSPSFGGFFPATDPNVAFIESQPAGVVHPTLTGAEVIALMRDGTAAAAAPLAPLQFLGDSVSFPNAVENGLSDDSATTYTVRWAWDVNDQMNFYASVGTGFKATSWNLSRDSRPVEADFADLGTAGLLVNNLAVGTRFAGPEDSTVIELGLKARFDRGALNVAIFDQEIEGFQSNIFRGTGFSLANAGKQSTTGLELDLTYDATDDLTLTFAGTFLDPIYDSFEGASGIVTVDNPTGQTDLSGTEPAGVHKISTSTSATYNMEFSNGMTAFLRGDYLYESNVQMLENVPADVASRQVNTLNASFGLQTTSDWNFILWGRNVTNDEYLLSAFPSVAQPGSYSGYPNQPRTYGLTVQKGF